MIFISALAQSHAQNSSNTDLDGRWQLTIEGEDQVEFGTEQLAGGLMVSWQATLEFTILNRQFSQGTGRARLLPGIQVFSRPEKMFLCRQETGVFASRSGNSYSTPHLRYQSFPLSGLIHRDEVRLKPFVEYPGNYYALLYACETQDSLGSFWLDRSPRTARELGKRQDAILSSESGLFKARIKEVKNIAPGPEITVPLIDGLSFTLTEPSGARKMSYQLKRLGNK